MSIKPFEHVGWQDDWKYWHANGERHKFAKPYSINLDNENAVSIFFDDNALDKEIIGIKPTLKIMRKIYQKMNQYQKK